MPGSSGFTRHKQSKTEGVMKNKVKQLAAAFLIAVAIIVSVHPEPVSAAPSAPNNLYFVQWAKSDFTSFRVRFTTKQYVSGVQYRLTLTNGKTDFLSSHWDGPFSSGTTLTMTFYDFSNNRVRHGYVRTYRYTSSGRRVYSNWSNAVHISPSPVKNKVKASIVSSKSTNVRLKWNTIYGCHGYNIYVTTNPAGKWYWNQSTRESSTATSAVLKTFKGGKLKPYTTYYVRVASRRKRHGVFCKIWFPSTSFWNCRFKLTK